MKKLYLAETPEEKRRFVSIAFSMVPVARGFYFAMKHNVKEMWHMTDINACQIELFINDDDVLAFDFSNIDKLKSED